MKTSNTLVLFMFLNIALTPVVSAINALTPNSGQKSKIPIKNLESNFQKNTGQWSSEILFQGANLYFLENSLSFHARIEDEEVEVKTPINLISGDKDEKSIGIIWNLNFKNCNKYAKVLATGEKPSVFSYVNERGNFACIPAANGITYSNIYDSIDIEYYNSENGLEYDVIVHPGGNPNNVIFSYDGINGLAINPLGQLEVKIGYGLTSIEEAPYAYQKTKDGKIKEIASDYKLLNDKTFSFEIIGDYDKNLDLIIDPFYRKWGTFLRAMSTTYSYDNAVDNQGNIYTTGWMIGQYPTTVGVVTSSGYKDVYVAKLTRNGDSLLYFILIGSVDRDEAFGIDVDNFGAAYITGNTESSNFPHTSILGNTYNGNTDAFVTKINTLGTGLVYSRFIGGTNNDLGYDITVDKINLSAYVTGTTASANFPVTSGVVQDSLSGGYDAFITCIDPTGVSPLPIFSTYFGGTQADAASCIFRVPSGDIYIGGITNSGNLPTSISPVPYQSVNNGSVDGFIAKFNASCTSLDKSTYIGGSAYDEIDAIDVNSSGQVYITGSTDDNLLQSIHFPTTSNALQAIAGGNRDVFVTKLKSDFSTPLIYSTFLGGYNQDYGMDIKVNAAGEAYVTGFTASNNFPLTLNNTFQPIYGGGEFDFFLSHINATGSNFACGGSTFVGGDHDDYSRPKLTLDTTGFFDTLVISGTSHSANFPTSLGSYQPTHISSVLNDDQPVVIKFTTDCEILGPPTGIIEDLSYEDTICAGQCWIITAPVLSGNPTLTVGNYQSISINGNTQLMVNICGLDTGRHMFMCQVNGTSTPFLIYVTVLPNPSVINLGADRFICPGSFTTLSTPALTGISYSWSGPNSFTSTSSHVSVYTPGTYILTASNGVGCSVSDTIILRTLSGQQSFEHVCRGGAGVMLNGGNSAVSYSWYPAIGLTNPNISNPIASPLVTTTYVVTATYANGCIDTGVVVVTVISYSIGGPLSVCPNTCITLSIPPELSCIESAVWYFSPLHPFPNGQDIPLGTGNTICVPAIGSGHYCVKITTCGEACDLVLCRDITVADEKECKKQVSNNGCCNISTQRVSSSVQDKDVSSFAVYPNPVSDSKMQLTFKVPSSGQLKISILNFGIVKLR